MSKFKFFNRGAKTTMLLIPGWACDYRVFGALNIRANYLVPIEFSPFDFEDGLLKAMEENKLDKVSILGWSMGAFIASDFLPDYRDRVSEVMLVSARRRYEKEKIENTRGLLKKNKEAFLYKFYRDFFSKNERDYFVWFKKRLLKSYLNKMKLDSLLAGLDYLLESEIKPQALQDLDVKLIHGEEDRIAPIEEARDLKACLPKAAFISIEGAGHMPFLSPSFEKRFNDKHLI